MDTNNKLYCSDFAVGIQYGYESRGWILHYIIFSFGGMDSSADMGIGTRTINVYYEIYSTYFNLFKLLN